MTQDCIIYVDHWISRKKRVNSVYFGADDNWTYHTLLQDALQQAQLNGCTTITLCGIDRTYHMKLLSHEDTQEEPQWQK